MIKNAFLSLKKASPIVHCITNYVTANDCANILLGCGASPIMASDKNEAAEVTAAADALVINLGTPDENRILAMIASGKTANDLGIPVVFDPVGVGVSDFRSSAAGMIMNGVKLSVIRGNLSEIKTLCGIHCENRGVDADFCDLSDSIEDRVIIANKLSSLCGAVTVISGREDIISDGSQTAVCRNGDEIMSRVTGAGCQFSCLCGAFAAANPENIFGAVLSAAVLMGEAGERARARMDLQDGNAAVRGYIIDAVCNMTADELERYARYEVL